MTAQSSFRLLREEGDMKAAGGDQEQAGEASRKCAYLSTHVCALVLECVGEVELALLCPTSSSELLTLPPAPTV